VPHFVNNNGRELNIVHSLKTALIIGFSIDSKAAWALIYSLSVTLNCHTRNKGCGMKMELEFGEKKPNQEWR